tara:strand:- start:214 stop:1140 length:927 start_codon:yes stop_codon:yes gene_type:complete
MDIILKFISYLTLFMTLAGFLRSYWWGFTAFGFFRPQYAVLSFLGLIGAFLLSMPFLIFINAISFATNMFLLQGWFPRKHEPDAGAIHIASINTWKSNRKRDKLIQYIDKHAPEVLLLMEVTEELKESCAKIFDNYPYHLSHYVRDGFEIWLLSKHEMHETQIFNIGVEEGQTPLLSCRIMIAGRMYRLLSAHPRPAINRDYARSRIDYFEEFSRIVHKSREPVIALGDFNSVPWEPHFKDFLDHTKMRSTMELTGYRMTWPRYFRPMGIPMDHILISRSITPKGLAVGPDVGSDHYPVALQLEVFEE